MLNMEAHKTFATVDMVMWFAWVIMSVSVSNCYIYSGQSWGDIGQVVCIMGVST